MLGAHHILRVSRVRVKWTVAKMKFLCICYVRSGVQKFPAWHTKAAPNGKCCEGYIVPSVVCLMYQLKVCWNKGRLCWKIAKLFYFCHLKKLVRPETFGPYCISYVELYGHSFGGIKLCVHRSGKETERNWSLRRPISIWEDNIKNILQGRICGWLSLYVPLDRVQCTAVMNNVI